MPAVFMLISLLFFGCTQTVPTPSLINYPQDITPLVSQAKSLPSLNMSLQKDFNKKYFAPWNHATLVHTKEEVTWAWRAYTYGKGYVGENRQPRPKEWFETLQTQANFENFGFYNQKAITLRNSSLRNFPTHKPLFKDFNLAGEGYPFDYMQNSRIALMQPIRISHYSKDGAWALVESAFSVGWIPSTDIVVLDEPTIQTITNALKIVITHDNTPIYTTTQEFATYGKTGTLLPLHVNTNGLYKSYRIFKNSQGKAVKQELLLSSQYAQPWPLALTQENLITIGTPLLGEAYGWGGLFDNRDCSAMTKDFFAPFGLWLPRNSAAQKNAGHYIDLKNLDNQRKEAMIQKYGIPFLTLLYLQGHIMLYAGVVDGKAIVMHNTWGVKTLEEGQEGRAIIGQSIVSDLYLGETLPNVVEKSQLIAKVQGMTILTPTSSHPLALAYPTAIQNVIDNTVHFYDESTLPYDDTKIKTDEEAIENADIEDQFRHPYPALTPLQVPTQDPGRIRNDALFKKLYGETKEKIQANLVTVTWLPTHGAKTLQFNKNHGAAKALQAVSNELDTLDDALLAYLNDPSGTYTYRTIAGTDRLSMHSYGIAIDINTKKGDYWRWSKTGNYQNKIPQTIVHIFEKHGFVWGGRWRHFDTFHFEYRPELFQP